MHRYIALATVTNRDLPIGGMGPWDLPERLKYEGKRPKMGLWDYGLWDYGTGESVRRHDGGRYDGGRYDGGRWSGWAVGWGWKSRVGRSALRCWFWGAWLSVCLPGIAGLFGAGFRTDLVPGEFFGSSFRKVLTTNLHY